MATVHLPSGLTRHTGGVDTVEIDAARIPELFTALCKRFPAMADQLADVAVAIDGQIYAEPGYQPLRADSEVHLVPRISGD